MCVCWTVDRIVHLEHDDFVAGSLAHFGFHQRGRYYAIDHRRHVAGLVGDDGTYVLDSGNFALRRGYDGDGDDARSATFGSDPTAQFDGPISLALDEDGNAYVGDRFNHAVRALDRESSRIATIAGRRGADPEQRNDPREGDPLRVNLPAISSMDYADGRLYVPTDLEDGSGELVVLHRVVSSE